MDVAANRHHFADRFHRGREKRFRSLEFFKGKTRDFGDDIVDRRFERGGCRTGDVIVDFIEGVTHCQLGRDLGDRETSCFRSQR